MKLAVLAALAAGASAANCPVITGNIYGDPKCAETYKEFESGKPMTISYQPLAADKCDLTENSYNPDLWEKLGGDEKNRAGFVKQSCSSSGHSVVFYSDSGCKNKVKEGFFGWGAKASCKPWRGDGGFFESEDVPAAWKAKQGKKVLYKLQDGEVVLV